MRLGQKAHLISKSLCCIKQNAMGQDIEIKSVVSLDIDLEVKSTTSDILLTHAIKRLQVKSEVMGNSMEFIQIIKLNRSTIIRNTR